MMTTTSTFYRDKNVPVSDLEKLLPQAHHPATQGKPIPISEVAKLLGGSLGPALRLLFKRTTLEQWRRVLHHGVDPLVLLLIQANNTALINRWLNKGSKVVFLSSFPRSGNTWMRFMLSDVLLQMHGVETTTQLPVHPDNLVAEFSVNSLARRITRCPAWAFETSLAFIKTHCGFGRVEEILADGGRQPSASQRDCRILYVYRSPEDALVSAYHLKNRDCFSHSRATRTIDEFCRAEVSGWVRNISSYLRAAENGFPTFFVSYDWLLEKPAAVLTDLLHWLNVPHDSQIAQRAVSNMQFAKLQALEIKANQSRTPGHEKKLFFRRGGPGSGQAELQESTLREIRQQTDSWFRQAEIRRLNQPSACPVPATIRLDALAATPPQNGKAGPAKFPLSTS
jgi:hypothetical protein